MLWIVGLLPPVLAELDDDHSWPSAVRSVSLRTILDGVLSAGVVLVIALWISSTIEKRILREAVPDLSMRKVASNAIRAVLLLIGLLFALSAVGVDLTALSVLGGALGVGLGFGLQKLAANYVSGFVILLERVDPHRRQRAGRRLRGPHHRHQDALHAGARAATGASRSCRTNR